MIMEFKFRVNYVWCKEVTVEAAHMVEAMKKVKEKAAEPVPYRELTFRNVIFEEISPSKWKDE